MPSDGLELPDGCYPRHDGQVPLAADLGRHRAAGVTDDADVAGLDELQSHEAMLYMRSDDA